MGPPPHPLLPRPRLQRLALIARLSSGPKPLADGQVSASTVQCEGTLRRSVRSHTIYAIAWEGANAQCPETTFTTALSSDQHALMWVSTVPLSINR